MRHLDWTGEGVFLILGALSVSSALAAETPQPPTRGEALAVVVERGPAVDGTMEDPVWDKCPPWPLGECTSADGAGMFPLGP